MNFSITAGILYTDSIEICIPNMRFVEQIGAGANANTFLAYNELLRRNEAIKIWHPRSGQGKVDIVRFSEEVKKNANVCYPNIAVFYDANIIDGIHYARLEYIPGPTLRDFLSTKHCLAIRYRILEIIINTMKSVYTAGFYHGDLHDRNVIIYKGEPYIIDFGTSYFSGIEASHNRDCVKFLELSYNVLDELHELTFLDHAEIIRQWSLAAANLLSKCLPIIWGYKNSETSALDDYTYKEWGFRFSTLCEEFSFVNKELVEEFYSRNFEPANSSKKALFSERQVVNDGTQY